jgi:general stress protein YciG
LKARDKNLANNPNFYKEIGSIGGKVGVTGGFYNNHELASRAGRIGGSRSRRRKKTTINEE